jgi:transcription elongation factor Elf1
MAEQEFRRSVSTDSVPRGSLCEWCGEPAVVQITAIGGRSHNERGLFCRTCGESFARTVAQTVAASNTINYDAR